MIIFLRSAITFFQGNHTSIKELLSWPPAAQRLPPPPAPGKSTSRRSLLSAARLESGHNIVKWHYHASRCEQHIKEPVGAHIRACDTPCCVDVGVDANETTSEGQILTFGFLARLKDLRRKVRSHLAVEAQSSLAALLLSIPTIIPSPCR